GVGFPFGQRIAGHGLGRFGVAEDRGDVARQRGGVKQLFRDDHGCRCVGKAAGIGGLVVAGGGGIGDQDRRAADDRDVGDRGGAGAADHQLRLGEAAGDVGEERGDLGADTGGLIGGGGGGGI